MKKIPSWSHWEDAADNNTYLHIEKQDKDNVKKGNKQALFKRIFPSALLHDKKACRRIGSML